MLLLFSIRHMDELAIPACLRLHLLAPPLAASFVLIHGASNIAPRAKAPNALSKSPGVLGRHCCALRKELQHPVRGVADQDHFAGLGAPARKARDFGESPGLAIPRLRKDGFGDWVEVVEALLDLVDAGGFVPLARAVVARRVRAVDGENVAAFGRVDDHVAAGTEPDVCCGLAEQRGDGAVCVESFGWCPCAVRGHGLGDGCDVVFGDDYLAKSGFDAVGYDYEVSFYGFAALNFDCWELFADAGDFLAEAKVAAGFERCLVQDLLVVGAADGEVSSINVSFWC